MYRAKIQRQFRDVATSTPKVLLTDITSELGEFRDHCWVELSDQLRKLVPDRCGQKLAICFKASVKQYYSGKSTLHKIKDIHPLTTW